MKQWKSIRNFEGLYEVSNSGQVKSLSRRHSTSCKKLTPSGGCSGYQRVTLRKDNKSHFFYVHRLVAMTFIDNNNNYKQVNHKDGNKKNNKATNLEWVTNKSNHEHAITNNLYSRVGENNTNCKLTDDQVEDIRKNNHTKLSELSKIFNVSVAHIRRIKNGRTRKEKTK